MITGTVVLLIRGKGNGDADYARPSGKVTVLFKIEHKSIHKFVVSQYPQCGTYNGVPDGYHMH